MSKANSDLPDEGEVFLFPLEDRRFGVCRVVSKTQSEVLVVASPWIGSVSPRLDDPLLRAILILSHHAWNKQPAMAWISDPPPKTFKHIGVIAPSVAERQTEFSEFGAWAFFPIQLHSQSLWDADAVAVIRHEHRKVDEQTAVGSLVLRRFNGDEEFRLRSATILAVGHGDGVRLWFEVETDGVPVKVLPDTAELGAHPKAEVAVTLTKLDPNGLVGRDFTVPSGNDESNNSHVATIYYVEHEYLNNNKIEIVDRQDNVFRVRWSGTTTDVNYYDGSKPDTKLEIDGRFTFKNLDEWI